MLSLRTTEAELELQDALKLEKFTLNREIVYAPTRLEIHFIFTSDCGRLKVIRVIPVIDYMLQLKPLQLMNNCTDMLWHEEDCNFYSMIGSFATIRNEITDKK